MAAAAVVAGTGAGKKVKPDGAGPVAGGLDAGVPPVAAGLGGSPVDVEAEAAAGGTAAADDDEDDEEEEEGEEDDDEDDEL